MKKLKMANLCFGLCMGAEVMLSEPLSSIVANAATGYILGEKNKKSRA